MQSNYFCGIHCGEKNIPIVDDQTKIIYFGLYNTKLKFFYNGHYPIKNTSYGCSFDVFKANYQFIIPISKKKFIELSELSLEQIKMISVRQFLIDNGMEEHGI